MGTRDDSNGPATGQVVLWMHDVRRVAVRSLTASPGTGPDLRVTGAESGEIGLAAGEPPGRW